MYEDTLVTRISIASLREFLTV